MTGTDHACLAKSFDIVLKRLARQLLRNPQLIGSRLLNDAAAEISAHRGAVEELQRLNPAERAARAEALAVAEAALDRIVECLVEGVEQAHGREPVAID